MNNKQPNSIKKLALVVLIFTLSLCACQPTGMVQPTSDSQTSSQRPSDALPGDIDLPDPAVGLSQLPGFNQTLTIITEGSLNGEPYKSIQTMDRTTNGENELVKISDSTTASKPVNLQVARMDGYQYSIEQEGQSCHAAPLIGKTFPLNDPSSRLLAVYGATKNGREEIRGISTLHYSFNEKSVARKSGEDDHAQGEFWIAEVGGYVVKYILSVNTMSGDFSGKRSWSYELVPLTEKDAIQLPGSCQPVLVDLPTLPDSANLIMQPGFQQYLTNSTRTEVVNFYTASLPPLGWQALPGSRLEDIDLTADVQVLAFNRETTSGSILLVIRLDEKDSMLRVTAQTAINRQALEVNNEITTAISEEQETPSTEITNYLPDDLPSYPGAAVISKMDSNLLLESTDSTQEIASFYKKEMVTFGWILNNELIQSGMTVQTWGKEEDTLMITFIENQGKVQIMISAND